MPKDVYGPVMSPCEICKHRFDDSWCKECTDHKFYEINMDYEEF